MPLKVALIIERANIILGGAERSVFELSLALGSVGMDVDIIAAKGETDAKNIHLLCNDTKGKRTSYFRFSKALQKHLYDNNYDIVHSVLPFGFADIYQPRGGCYKEAILRNAASYQNPLVSSFKKATAFTNIHRTVYYLAEKKLCKNPEGPTVAALSHYVQEQFRRHYKMDRNRIVTIPNGINTNKKPDKSDADVLRAQILSKLDLTEPDEPVFFLFVANNFRLKGLSPLLKAFHKLVKESTERPPYLIVAGHGKASGFKSLSRLLGISDRVIFLGQVRNIQNALSITDAAVLPTYYDPASRFVLEALASKTPVITTSFNGATDLFKNERHGLVIDRPENITALKDALKYFCSTDIIENTQKNIEDDNIEEKISILRVANDLKELYNSIISNKER